MVVVCKLTGAFVVLLSGLAGGLAPQLIFSPTQEHIATANVFSAGVFFSISLVHILPESIEQLNVQPLFVLMMYSAGFLLTFVLNFVCQHQHSHSTPLMGHVEMASLYEVSHSDGAISPNSNDSEDRIRVSVSSSAIVVLVASLTTHSLLTGLAIGSGDFAGCGNLWVTLFGIISHKFLAALSISMSAAQAMPIHTAWMVLIAFSFVTPVGICIGLLLSITLSELEIWEFIAAGLLSCAGGTFLFVAVMELLPQLYHIRKKSMRNTAIFLMITGYIAMTLLALVV